ncbi:hypothetical protein ACH5RR_024252 [Cinchona calisaya]|uniref:RRM domain-containing protein n=1 Tax=Cinchona calisaya TaxID=153742 RepID=A0ABD2YW35_9GENT
MAGAGIHPYHQQWPTTAVPLPPPPTPMDNSNRLAIDEVRTIFISGLPPDVKERELQNLLRWLPGYEASQDMVFYAESNSVLHTEMAKKNLFVKRVMYLFLFRLQAVMYLFRTLRRTLLCNTLSIGNLGENINEEELRGLFSVQPGFKQMKVLRQERHTVCFIEFEDVNSATNVHHNLQRLSYIALVLLACESNILSYSDFNLYLVLCMAYNRSSPPLINIPHLGYAECGFHLFVEQLGPELLFVSGDLL